MGDGVQRDDDLLGVEELVRLLGVGPVTVYRWCREGRLPCLKVGKAWRVRRSALEAFLRAGERRRTLVDHLRAFLTVPDYVVAVAEDEELLLRLEAAFMQVGEARGGLLVKFHGGETRPAEELRAGLRRHGLDVERLEAEGRFRWSPEADPTSGRAAALRELMAATAGERRPVWASFDWTSRVSLAAALAQQEELAGLVGASALVVKTGVLETVADAAPPEERRRVLWGLGSGQIRIGRDGLFLSRGVPLPPR